MVKKEERYYVKEPALRNDALPAIILEEVTGHEEKTPVLRINLYGQREEFSGLSPFYKAQYAQSLGLEAVGDLNKWKTSIYRIPSPLGKGRGRGEGLC